jgi:hypothetical protein
VSFLLVFLGLPSLIRRKAAQAKGIRAASGPPFVPPSAPHSTQRAETRRLRAAPRRLLADGNHEVREFRVLGRRVRREGHDGLGRLAVRAAADREADVVARERDGARERVDRARLGRRVREERSAAEVGAGLAARGEGDGEAPRELVRELPAVVTADERRVDLSAVGHVRRKGVIARGARQKLDVGDASRRGGRRALDGERARRRGVVVAAPRDADLRHGRHVERADEVVRVLAVLEVAERRREGGDGDTARRDLAADERAPRRLRLGHPAARAALHGGVEEAHRAEGDDGRVVRGERADSELREGEARRRVARGARHSLLPIARALQMGWRCGGRRAELEGMEEGGREGIRARISPGETRCRPIRRTDASCAPKRSPAANSSANCLTLMLGE